MIKKKTHRFWRAVIIALAVLKSLSETYQRNIQQHSKGSDTCDQIQFLLILLYFLQKEKKNELEIMKIFKLFFEFIEKYRMHFLLNTKSHILY